MTLQELWTWIDGLPRIVDAGLIWVGAAIVVGLLAGRFIAHGDPDRERD